MKKLRILGLSLALMAGLQTVGWAQETKTESEVEQDLKRLREWVRLQSDKVATTTRAEWPSVKSDFARHADKIESGFQQLSENSKREYLELKAKFQELESKPFYDEIPLQAEEVRLREKELLGNFSNIQSIKPAQMREAYITFMQNVRAKRQSWIPRDWDYAEYILQNLAKRKEAVEANLTTLDEIKIRTLIGEFHTLRSGQEFKEKQKAKSKG
ncbi:hypothetical protein [Rufibacter quisquiliarum]|uniref:Uncharacterized protein n=1 Tax=Rufibacter quisquiliarum TaxID=1549639 RepID=A0A839GDY4_9BACT|nr:hypothetical protein [Rufibacter quisquiliarum]MBA9075743.1 hypothetical protein [Rufibacter quisquiliarum]